MRTCLVRAFIAAIIVLFVGTSLSVADIAPGPRPRPPQPAPQPDPKPEPKPDKPRLLVVTDPNVKDVTVVVPRALVEVRPGTSATPSKGSFELVSTVIAGLAMSGAIVAFGIWAARRRSKPVPVPATVAAVLVVMVLFTAIAIANGPPTRKVAQPGNEPPIPVLGDTGLTATVRVVDGSPDVMLVLPPGVDFKVQAK